MPNVILGGGITGLIWAFYHPDYTIYSQDIGGQMKSSFSLGPRYLHKTENSYKFLKKFYSSIECRECKVGYIDDSGWVENPGLDFRQKYFMKSRRQNSLEGFDSTVMNGNKSSFEILNVDFNDLINKLTQHVKFKNCKISSIDIKAKQIFSEEANFSYNKLVSTIPLNVFLQISNNQELSKQRKALDVTYFKLEQNSLLNLKKYDFVYDCRSATPFHRMTRDGDYIVADIIGDCDYQGYLEKKVMKNNQIISLHTVPRFEDIIFLGRYGTWDRTWKIETVIDRSIQ